MVGVQRLRLRDCGRSLHLTPEGAHGRARAVVELILIVVVVAVQLIICVSITLCMLIHFR